MQSLVRRWLAQKALDLLRDEQTRRLAWLEMQERRREEEKEEQLKDLQQRRMNPKTKEDFNLLYKALESKPSSLFLSWVSNERFIDFSCSI